MDNWWKLGPREAFWADAKFFRLGEVSGGNQNFRVLMGYKAKTYE